MYKYISLLYCQP